MMLTQFISGQTQKILGLAAMVAAFNSQAAGVVATVIDNRGEQVVLDTDLARMKTPNPLLALAFNHMAMYVDNLFVNKYKKYEEVPKYRVDRVLYGILAHNRHSQEENSQHAFDRHLKLWEESCVSNGFVEADGKTIKQCPYKITMSDVDWLLPLPNFARPATEKDIAFYDKNFMLSYYKEIREFAEDYLKKGETKILGIKEVNSRLEDDMYLNAEEKKARLAEVMDQFAERYRKHYIFFHFVKNKAGTFWAEPVDSQLRKFRWDTVSITSPQAPKDIADLKKIIKQGLNAEYIRQKRMEVLSDGKMSVETFKYLAKLAFEKAQISIKDKELFGLESIDDQDVDQAMLKAIDELLAPSEKDAMASRLHVMSICDSISKASILPTQVSAAPATSSGGSNFSLGNFFGAR